MYRNASAYVGENGLLHPQKDSKDPPDGLVYYPVYSWATEDQPKQ